MVGGIVLLIRLLETGGHRIVVAVRRAEQQGTRCEMERQVALQRKRASEVNARWNKQRAANSGDLIDGLLEPSGVKLAARAVHAEIEDGADPLLAEFRRRGIDRIGENEQTSAVDLDDDVPGLGELERRVNSGEMAVAFAMYPVSMKQLMDIADNDLIMPPKVTWFEPKLRSGLVVHSLQE